MSAKYASLRDVSGVHHLQWGVPKYGATLMLKYHKFILCKLECRDFEVSVDGRFKLSPTAEIDEVWHDHMLRPGSYYAYMRWLQGDGLIMIDHNPDFEGDSDLDKKQRLERTREVWRTLFGEEMEIAMESQAPTDEEISFQLFVCTLTKKSWYDVKLSTSVTELKCMIQDKEGIPPDEFRLQFAGRELAGARTIGSYGITEESTIHMIVKLRGC